MGGRDATMVLLDENGIRCDGRKIDEPRKIVIKAGGLKNADGSAYIEFGDNKILVGVFGPRDVHPKHMSNTDTGILRVRYHMEPFSVGERKRPAPSRREIEISKVIKEALEPAVMLEKFPRTAVDVFIEVLQADGGTRTASITGGCVALFMALKNHHDDHRAIKSHIAAVSLGILNGQVALDLDYKEDSSAETDLNLVMTEGLELIEIQGTGEEAPFTRDELNDMLEVGSAAIADLIEKQKACLL